MSQSDRDTCNGVLTAALDNQSPWVRVHAAEALIAIGQPGPALAAFRKAAQTTEPKYRIVVWRVLARAAPIEDERKQYIDKIRTALLDSKGPDQTHAMEALAKLNEALASDAERQNVRAVADSEGPAAAFADWRLAQTGDDSAIGRLTRLLDSADVVIRARAAYVLARLQPLPIATMRVVARRLSVEPSDSPVRQQLRTLGTGDELRMMAKDRPGTASGKYTAAMWLAEVGKAEDIGLLKSLLDNKDSDVRVAGAYALIRIDARAKYANRTTRATVPGSRYPPLARHSQP